MRRTILTVAVVSWMCVWPVRAQDGALPQKDAAIGSASAQEAVPHPLMQQLEAELDYSMEHLAAEDGTKPYYMAYTVYDEHRASIGATLGAIARDDFGHQRNLNIDLRVGDYTLDNTHQLRDSGPSHASGSGNIPIAADDHPESIRHTLWYYTDIEFKDAVQRLREVKANLKVKVEEDDQSDDFSRETPHVQYESPASLSYDRDAWRERVRRLSKIAREHPLIYNSYVSADGLAKTRFLVSSEGARLQTVDERYRVTVSAATRAEDGMSLFLQEDFHAATVEGLPDDAELAAAFRGVIDRVLALREAPLAEPYIGPAILKGEASAVFFHEIFGHRIEGHRQKDVTEGQTFRKKVGQSVLPEFISVHDDPTRRRAAGIDLMGAYRFDDEGVAASDVMLVEKGILKTFLMSRTPIEGFAVSNGHGRRQPGNAVGSRQANLIVDSTRQVPFGELRTMLIEECKKQDRPYGLLFEDISGGFTTTDRRGPQSFKVLPLVVYKVHADGRPDELIRGVDIVGTPLTCFEGILHTGNDPGVFNGSCGAESGWVPVAAVSPSILVSKIEIEKREREQNRPPILTSPIQPGS